MGWEGEKLKYSKKWEEKHRESDRGGQKVQNIKRFVMVTTAGEGANIQLAKGVSNKSLYPSRAKDKGK
ncbi:hypothetical protein SK128_027554, partial [Halocaridina rubra]